MDNSIIPLVPVILSGGVGSRLWPVSRKQHPKPFIALPDGDTLMAKTLKRSLSVSGANELMIVTNRDLYFHTKDEIIKMQSKGLLSNALNLHYLLEPFGRNTAPAVVAAAYQLFLKHGPDVVMLVMPADHLIANENAFSEAVKLAYDVALEGQLVTFGIHPEYPETGYGYIHSSKEESIKSECVAGPSAFRVERFVENPNLATAQSYVESGDYYWNAGIFCFTAGVLLQEVETVSPSLLSQIKSTFKESSITENATTTQVELSSNAFAKVEDVSIDYALLEKSNKVSVVPCDIGWSDIGSWSALSDLMPQDTEGNHLYGDVIALKTRNTNVYSPGQLTATLGIDDLIIVNTGDAVLVAHKSAEQDVKKIVLELDKQGRDTHITHQTVYRPWGNYTVLEEGESFKIKRIIVKPSCSLSLQMHHHRSEHWVVVGGCAKVINNENAFFLSPNESTFISAGHKHRLENPGKTDLIVIEVQSGEYLGEDDIVRFDDKYGRQ
ncbi:mannose-1-phosphate guanylyltransferase/mannose-6-phosphate isomerase [Marinomonas algicola]|uniref:mannose-1-phosphate guanylyltransferase/mannose-6-phosphate isomerase n=1 Tax=Marinomonas algicola TaxID=2773454 RepID=UPI0019D5ABEB|nr:mannose-1-phosphate guanylyltransferase/mannose-6-phosphate isomerase [Marinomonas algicola]